MQALGDYVLAAVLDRAECESEREAYGSESAFCHQ